MEYCVVLPGRKNCGRWTAVWDQGKISVLLGTDTGVTSSSEVVYPSVVLSADSRKLASLNGSPLGTEMLRLDRELLRECDLVLQAFRFQSSSPPR